MRRAIRAAVLLLAAYILQSTVMGYLRIGDVIPDLVCLVLFAFGTAFGLYGAIVGGIVGALLMEALSGELSGLTAAWCIAASGFAYWTSYQMRKPLKPGTGQIKKSILRMIPPVAASTVEITKEGIQVFYFYLTGVDIGFMHLYRVMIAGIEMFVLAFFFIGPIRRFLLRPAEQTLISKWWRKHRERREEKQVHRIRVKEQNQETQVLTKSTDDEPTLSFGSQSGKTSEYNRHIESNAQKPDDSEIAESPDKKDRIVFPQTRNDLAEKEKS